MKIGIFDSGVGGLTVLKEIQKIDKNLEIIYYADTLHSPYGSKTLNEIIKYCDNICRFFMDNQVDLIVIACNTATVASIEYLRKAYSSIPILGVIDPGAQAALKATKNNKIGVLATPLTVKTDAYKNEILKHSTVAEVYQQGCDLLCPMIESGWETHENNMDVLKGYINNLPENIDTLVLGCTHYPIIKEDVRKVFGGSIVDPAENTAANVELEIQLQESSKSFKRKTLDFFISGDLGIFRNIAEEFLGHPIDYLYKIPF